MKTTFKFLWPWLSWKRFSHEESGDNNRRVGIGFPTEISYFRWEKETHLTIQILGFGFSIERYPTRDFDID